MYGLIPTFEKGHYLTPKTHRKVRRHDKGWVILGEVSNPDPFERDEMLFWAPKFVTVAEYARTHNL